MNKYYGIFISTIAGLSTLIGYFSIYIKDKKESIISKSLAFASGVMATISIIDLIPTSIQNLSINNSLIYSIIYTLFFLIFGYLFCYIINKRINIRNDLYQTGIITMLGIIMHNIPEGVITYVLSTINLRLGILLSIAIVLHNIPEGISIAIPIYYSTNSKIKAFFYTLVSGISEPIGALLSMIFLHKYITNNIISIMFSVIAGFMIYISFNKLLVESKKYNYNVHSFFAFGSLFILIVEIILKM